MDETSFYGFVPQLSTIPEEHTEEDLMNSQDTEDTNVSPEGSFIDDVLMAAISEESVKDEEVINNLVGQPSAECTRHLRSHGPVEEQPHILDHPIEYKKRGRNI